MIDERRIPWLLRRGMKELDVVVTRFYERYYPTASEAERVEFVRLLDETEDPDIWAWLMGFEPPPAGITTNVIEQLRRHR